MVSTYPRHRPNRFSFEVRTLRPFDWYDFQRSGIRTRFVKLAHTGRVAENKIVESPMIRTEKPFGNLIRLRFSNNRSVSIHFFNNVFPALGTTVLTSLAGVRIHKRSVRDVRKYRLRYRNFRRRARRADRGPSYSLLDLMTTRMGNRDDSTAVDVDRKPSRSARSRDPEFVREVAAVTVQPYTYRRVRPRGQ